MIFWERPGEIGTVHHLTANLVPRRTIL